MTGGNPRGDGEPRICVGCQRAFRLVGALPMAAEIERCPTCLEALFDG